MADSGWRLSDLLGPASDRAAAEIDRTVRRLVRVYRRKYASVARREEDLCQDVMMAALREAKRIQAGFAAEPSNLDAWLNRVARNEVFKAFRDDPTERHPHHEAEERLPEPARPAPEVLVDLWRGLARLDPPCKDLIARVDYYGESRELAASRLQLNANAFRVRLHRCRKKLLDLLEGAGPELVAAGAR